MPKTCDNINVDFLHIFDCRTDTGFLEKEVKNVSPKFQTN